MGIQQWSERILVVDLQDDPVLSDDLNTLDDRLATRDDLDVVVNFGAVSYLNSSNIAKLLKIRKKLIASKRRFMLCSIATNVWGLFLVTGLDKVFDFTDDVASALATVQMTAE